VQIPLPLDSLLSPELEQQILAIYKDVDREVAAAGPVCQASGRCCRFKEYGHVLFLSQLEAEVLLARAPAFTQPVSPDFCPFQKDNLCTAREPRPLGCRIYFCDPAYQDTSCDITETYLRRLKELANEQGLPWLYAPLHYFLNQAAEPSGADQSAPSSVEQASGRRELPVITAND
jgi:hypothetical protein